MKREIILKVRQCRFDDPYVTLTDEGLIIDDSLGPDIHIRGRMFENLVSGIINAHEKKKFRFQKMKYEWDGIYLRYFNSFAEFTQWFEENKHKIKVGELNLNGKTFNIPARKE